jgi:hypothetical protein
MTLQHINLANSLLQLYRAVQPHDAGETKRVPAAAARRSEVAVLRAPAGSGLHSATHKEGSRAAEPVSDGW